MRIAFHLPNRNIPSADLRFPAKGNPGVGGTHFLFAALPYYLNTYFSDAVDCRLYAEVNQRLPENTPSRSCQNTEDAIVKAEEDGCDLFVFRPEELTNPCVALIQKTKMKLVAWEHNRKYPHGDALAQFDAVKLFVCVGADHLSAYADNPIIKKACFIHNFLDPSPYNPRSFGATDPRVVYIGSIIPPKGLHILAELWKYILDQVPNAKLDIIGNGQVYNENVSLGPWGLCEEEYEALIRKHISGPDGQPLPSVTLHGKLGSEKVAILQNARVGVPNPSALSETFCLTGVEMQACGTPVVTLDRFGFKDTVAHERSGYLCQDHQGILDRVIQLLKDPDQAFLMGQGAIDFVNERFHPYAISYQWLRLFSSLR